MMDQGEIHSKLELDEERLEIPGEREREYREKTIDSGIALPRKIFEQIQTLSARLGNR